MYTRFAKFFYFLSIGLFLFVFMYAYASMPDFATYEQNSKGLPVKQVSKESFFYFTVILFFVYNVLLVIPGKMIEMKGSNALHRLFPVGDSYRDRILAWIYSFIGVGNLCLSIMVFYIHSLTNQNEIRNTEYNVFFYLVPILLAAWVIGLFIVLVGKMKQVKTGTV
ncbi:DNA topoisomerase IV [uncultured Cyclobacterium sp.]|uniref:DNA topoisomerase IV n=1 Tax=uncultured Cyclobacterium sp. TaxID=453820 RepID=UPI0030ECD0C2